MEFVIVCIGLLVMFVIVGGIYSLIEYSSRPERFNSKIQELKSLGYKIKYSNQITGTISYTDKYGRRSSVSVYRGYNSHYRGVKKDEKNYSNRKR